LMAWNSPSPTPPLLWLILVNCSLSMVSLLRMLKCSVLAGYVEGSLEVKVSGILGDHNLLAR
jgi:hypothetical protein